eukprot:430116-Rhodomonas_salina.1
MADQPLPRSTMAVLTRAHATMAAPGQPCSDPSLRFGEAWTTCWVCAEDKLPYQVPNAPTNFVLEPYEVFCTRECVPQESSGGPVTASKEQHLVQTPLSPYALNSTHVAYEHRLRACYAMSGTDLADGAFSLRNTRYLPMTCPVLTLPLRLYQATRAVSGVCDWKGDPCPVGQVSAYAMSGTETCVCCYLPPFVLCDARY